MLKVSRGKKRLDDRSGYRLHDTRLIVIATEGQKTEPSYFSGFGSKNAKIVVLPTEEDNRSAPRYVLDRLNNSKKRYQIGPGDELWLVIDVDRWPPKEMATVAMEATKKGYKLAISNPCFEVWLLCHKQSPPKTKTSCNDIKTLLKDALRGSYNSSNLVFSDFADTVDQAIQNAQATDIHPGDRWPQEIGTHVYKVVQSILSLNIVPSPPDEPQLKNKESS